MSFHTRQCNTCNHSPEASLTREASLTHVATVMPPSPHLLRRARRASGGASALSSREATSASVRSRLVSNADQGERVRGRPVPSSLDWCQCVVCLEEAVLRVRRLAYRKTIVLVVRSLRFIHIAQVRPVQNAVIIKKRSHLDIELHNCNIIPSLSHRNLHTLACQMPRQA